MESISVIIPARKERFLDQTIEDIFKKFKNKPEVIVTLDGADANRLPEVKYIYNVNPMGMRTAINQAVTIASGKYLMKLDAHCMVDEDIDEKLIAEHQPNWVQIPRRKRLDAHNWKIDNSKPDVDYMYVGQDYMGIANRGANQDPEKKKKLIDDTDVFQGSCYFIQKDYFLKLRLLDAVNFSGSGYEALEIATKVKRDGGRVVRNKKTWYAHARLGRFYVADKDRSREYVKEFMNL